MRCQELLLHAFNVLPHGGEGGCVRIQALDVLILTFTLLSRTSSQALKMIVLQPETERRALSRWFVLKVNSRRKAMSNIILKAFIMKWLGNTVEADIELIHARVDVRQSVTILRVWRRTLLKYIDL